jgi:hypothetical protein
MLPAQIVICIPFWLGWITAWSFIIGILIGLHQIVDTDRAEQRALRYIESVSKETLFSRAFFVISKLSDDWFGPKLFSLKAFLKGLLLSLLMFILAFGVAAITSGMGSSLQRYFFLWEDPTFQPTAHLWSATITVSMAVIWLFYEYIYVVKSRWLIHLIHERMNWIVVLIILILDVASTLLILIYSAPVFLMISAKTFFYFASDALNHNFIFIHGGYHTHESAVANVLDSYTIPFYEPLTRSIYGDLVHAAMAEVNSYIHGHFSEYYMMEIGSAMDPNCTIRFTEDRAFIENCRSNFFYEAHVTFLFTTMLVSALATTIWVFSCSMTLFLWKLANFPKTSFIWLEKHKDVIWHVGFYLGIVALLGIVLAPFFYE